MEANIVVKAEDLTPDFADGICKVFSKGAILHIKIEYEMNGQAEAAPKRRGPKPKSADKPSASGKKRGRKPGVKLADNLPKKRGPKPKIVAA